VATRRVPVANPFVSNFPRGPFHRIVLAPARTRLNASAVRGPMSNPFLPGVIASPLVSWPGASSSAPAST
jgi:hypothetical protein